MSKQYGYVLNDLALLKLASKVCYSSPSDRDKKTLYEQIVLIIEENTKARHFDYYKDTRNSRQRIANKRLSKTLEEHKKFLRMILKSINQALDEPSCELDIYKIREDIKEFLGDELDVEKNKRVISRE